LLKKSNDHVKAKTYFTEAEIWKALLHMSKGLKALHDMNILHRDLKCANIFMSNDGTYKLGDLNVSKVSKRGMARTHTGTPYYTSPEVWKDKAYDLKCDIWSLGCVIYEMAALKPPFRASNLK
jgi:NIMA (never in mitosis gene a)-related kinase